MNNEQKEPDWLVKLKRELLLSKMTHNFTLSRDELTYLVGGRAALRAESGAGWISVEDRLPEYLPDQDFSARVWATDGKQLYIVERYFEGDGWLWSNCYGQAIGGDSECDDDYQITHWQPLHVPGALMPEEGNIERECCGTFHRTPHRSTCKNYRGKHKKPAP